MSEQRVDVDEFTSSLASEWDELVGRSTAGTFLHTRRFLSYHGDRFSDCSVVLRDSKNGRLTGVFPAAVNPADPTEVVTHPGSTFGGVVHDGSLAGSRMVEAVAVMCSHFASRGFTRLRYKAVPWIYHVRPAADDVYALAAAGATLYRCDLSCSIDLDNRGPMSERRRRGRRKAERAGAEIVTGPDVIEPLWRALEANLSARHDVRPTHTLDELQLLASRFPENIEAVGARRDDSVVAGTILFVSPRVVHTQYIASTDVGREIAALDAVLEHCILAAEQAGARYFDLGISTERDGTFLNEGLHRFKAEFGGGGCVHEFFELALG